MKFKRKFSAEKQGHKVKMKARTLESAENLRRPELISSFFGKSCSPRNQVFTVVFLVVSVYVVFAAFGCQVNCDKLPQVLSSSPSPSSPSWSSWHPDYLSVSAAIGRGSPRRQQQAHRADSKRASPASSSTGGSNDETKAEQQQQAAVLGSDEQPIGAANGFFGDLSHKRTPSFEAGQTARVVASSSQTEVFLPCKILDLDEQQTVSWIRKGDSLVLTIDKLKLIDDPRFQLAQSEQDWTLVLSQPSISDAGFYECQVSSMEPKLSKLVELRMIEAHSRISNLSTLFVKPNEQLNVTCTIESPQGTDFVYWYKNKEPVQFDNLRARRDAGSDGQSGQQPVDGRTRRRRRRSRSRGSKSPSVAASLVTVAGGEIKSYKRPSRLTTHEDDNEGQNDDHGDDRSRYDHEESQDDDRAAKKAGNLAKQAKTVNNKKGGNQRKANEDSSSNNNDDDVKLVRSSSSFIIKQVQANDTANYTCLPSNAKASHINVIVIENGGQSQPEKRSLQAVDGACSLHIRNTYKLSQEIYLLGHLIKLRLFATLGLPSLTQLNLATILRGQETSPPMLPEFEFKQQSIVNQLFKLFWSQEFIRILLTLISMVFYSRIKNLSVVTEQQWQQSLLPAT